MTGFPSGYKPYLPFVKPVIPDPVKHYDDAVAETDQVVKVEE